MASSGYTKKPGNPAILTGDDKDLSPKKDRDWWKITKIALGTAGAFIAGAFMLGGKVLRFSWNNKKIIPLGFALYQVGGAAYYADNFSDGMSYLIYDTKHKVVDSARWVKTTAGNIWGWGHGKPGKDYVAPSSSGAEYVVICSPRYTDNVSPPKGVSREDFIKLRDQFAKDTHARALEMVRNRDGKILATIQNGRFPVVYEPGYAERNGDFEITAFEKREEQACKGNRFIESARVYMPK